MRFIIQILIFLFLVQRCVPVQDNSRTQKLISPQQLEGTWKAEKWGLYHTIYFQDSTHVAFDNHIDTLFYYTYKVSQDTLYLYKAHGKLENYNIILTLTEDSLIFSNLLDKQGVQRYSRKTLH